jgi:hypothetical protein
MAALQGRATAEAAQVPATSSGVSHRSAFDPEDRPQQHDFAKALDHESPAPAGSSRPVFRPLAHEAAQILASGASDSSIDWFWHTDSAGRRDVACALFEGRVL